MKQETYNKIYEGYLWCIKNDKSFEFMIIYLQDYAKVNHDTILKFFYMSPEERIFYTIE